MTDMREYAAQHGWEVGSHLRYAGGVGPSSVITSIEADEVRISTPGDFPGRLTGGSSSGLEKWTLDWQYRAEKAEAAIARVRERAEGPTPAVHGDWMAGYAAAMRDILRALDDSEDALVQGAITAMLSEDAPLIDPDCRDGKHSSCVGGPCQCPCHELAAS